MASAMPSSPGVNEQSRPDVDVSAVGNPPVHVPALSACLPAQVGLPPAMKSFNMGNALGFAIPLSVKQKNWDGEFVDFAQLLSDNAIQLLNSQQQNAEMILAVNEAGGNQPCPHEKN